MYTLRNYIPISGPATRKPCTGAEKPFRYSLGFTPKWFHDRLDIDFSEKWHFDPQYRYDTLVEMKKFLYEKFPECEDFKPCMEGNIEYSCATLDGTYGAMIISAIYGLPVYYYCDNWPSAKPSDHFLKEKLKKMPPIDLDHNPAFQQLMDQMDYIEKKWGKISGYLNYQGVLNNAFRLRGQEIFIDMIDDPEFVHQLFEHISNTMIQTAHRIQERQRKSGFDINLISNSNCVINMISADMYEEFVLPYDVKISKEFERFGIHTCNWDATPYIHKLKKIKKMGYIDMGMMTDMAEMKKTFPNARRAVLYSPTKVEQFTMAEIEKDFRNIAEALAPCDLVLADMETTVSDKRIHDVLKLTEKISKELEEKPG